MRKLAALPIYLLTLGIGLYLVVPRFINKNEIVLVLEQPGEQLLTKQKKLRIKGRTNLGAFVEVPRWKRGQKVGQDGRFDLAVDLEEGANAFEVIVHLGAKSKKLQREVILDSKKPLLEINGEKDNRLPLGKDRLIQGRVIEQNLSSALLDGEKLALDREGRFSKTIALKSGKRSLSFVLKDLVGNEERRSITVAAEYPRVKGFTYLAEEVFSFGGQTFKVAVYRFDRFHQILKQKSLLKDDRHPACEFVLLPPKGSSGKFMMGSPENEKDRGSDEKQHEVTIKKRFLMARTEATQALWEMIGGKNKSDFKGDLLPVEQVSWDDIQKVLNGTDLRLPSEAEWEYACRAGTTTPFCFGKNITPQQVNYNGTHPYAEAVKGEYRSKTMAVGSLDANAFGLYEMHGNVWEWCQDTYQDYSGAPTDGSVWKKAGASGRVSRGGSWNDRAQNCRSADRSGNSPNYHFGHLGFRVVAGVSP